jgi:hypothetical protein
MSQNIIRELDSIIGRLDALKRVVLDNCTKPRFRVRTVPPEEAARDRELLSDLFTNKKAMGGKTRKHKRTNNKKSKRRY